LEPFKNISRNVNMVQLLWKYELWLLKNFKIKLAYNPAIALLGVHSPKQKTWSQRDVCVLIS
jgi:hypothetical protein